MCVHLISGFSMMLVPVIGDGNCLFRSLSHIIFGNEINTTDLDPSKWAITDVYYEASFSTLVLAKKSSDRFQHFCNSNLFGDKLVLFKCISNKFWGIILRCVQSASVGLQTNYLEGLNQ